MPNYISGELIKELRRRKKWQQAYMQKLSEAPESLLVTLSRVENLHQQPTQDTMNRFLDLLGMPAERYFCPYLENRRADTDLMRERLLFYLDRCDIDGDAFQSAKETLAHLSETLDMDSIVNRQFLLSCRAQLCVFDGDYDKAEVLVKEGLALTYPEFNLSGSGNEIFIFEEVDLLHTLAITYIHRSRPHDAIALLDRAHAGVDNTPINYSIKEKKLPKVLLPLAKCLMDNKDYENALERSEAGLKSATENHVGRYIPDLAHTKALCLFHLNRKEEASAFMQYAYFAYLLMGDKKGADEVLLYARDNLDITIETYGTEKLAYTSPTVAFDHSHESFTTAEDNIGALIRQLRLNAGLSAKEVHGGLCSKANYYFIESGKHQKANYLLLRAIFQRLGRDINLFFSMFLSREEIDELNLRDKIIDCMIVKKYEEADILLKELQRYPSAKTHLGQQQLKFLESVKMEIKEGFTEACADLLMEAIALTIPDYNEEEIENYRLTADEVGIITMMASYYDHRGDHLRNKKIIECALKSMKHSYVDEPLIYSYYLNTMNKYADCLIKNDMYQEALQTAVEGEELCKRYGRFAQLPYLADVKGNVLKKMGRMEESLASYAMAFYGYLGTGNVPAYEEMAEIAKEAFGVTFVH